MQTVDEKVKQLKLTLMNGARFTSNIVGIRENSVDRVQHVNSLGIASDDL